eukprot:scaffold588_cov247-Pinguiococcus_pyrenoidosus.AAC.3
MSEILKPNLSAMMRIVQKVLSEARRRFRIVGKETFEVSSPVASRPETSRIDAGSADRGAHAHWVQRSHPQVGQHVQGAQGELVGALQSPAWKRPSLRAGYHGRGYLRREALQEGRRELQVGVAVAAEHKHLPPELWGMVRHLGRARTGSCLLHIAFALPVGRLSPASCSPRRMVHHHASPTLDTERRCAVALAERSAVGCARLLRVARLTDCLSSSSRTRGASSAGSQDGLQMLGPFEVRPGSSLNIDAIKDAIRNVSSPLPCLAAVPGHLFLG